MTPEEIVGIGREALYVAIRVNCWITYWNFPGYDTNSRNDINFCTETGCNGTSVAFLGKMDCRQYDVLHCYNI